MRRKIYIISVVIISLVSLIVFNTRAQNNNDCMKSLKEGYLKLSKMQVPAGDVYIKYRVIVKMNEKTTGSKSEPVVNDTEYILNKDRSYIITDAMEVYQDQNSIVAVSHANKTVSMLNVFPSAVNNIAKQKLKMFSDTLLTFSYVTSCKEMIIAGKKYLKIDTKMNDAGKKLFNIHSVSYTLDLLDKSMSKVSIRHNDNYSIDEMSIEFLKTDIHSKQPLLRKTPKEIVFEGGKVKKKYAGYTVKDLRSK